MKNYNVKLIESDSKHKLKKIFWVVILIQTLKIYSSSYNFERKARKVGPLKCHSFEVASEEELLRKSILKEGINVIWLMLRKDLDNALRCKFGRRTFYLIP